eukprot:TRINITY_DN9793_c0_g3_i1.p1 TRINITY_DN9793_c0_g3~~TRINITY_DN9793_c0_g3_i1.p1  ORF type:complete len:392 (-),score=109.41 TRINITY_DN9793_c0_g3_i1:97-1272(-)
METRRQNPLTNRQQQAPGEPPKIDLGLEVSSLTEQQLKMSEPALKERSMTVLQATTFFRQPDLTTYEDNDTKLFRLCLPFIPEEAKKPPTAPEPNKANLQKATTDTHLVKKGNESQDYFSSNSRASFTAANRVMYSSLASNNFLKDSNQISLTTDNASPDQSPSIDKPVSSPGMWKRLRPMQNSRRRAFSSILGDSDERKQRIAGKLSRYDSELVNSVKAKMMKDSSLGPREPELHLLVDTIVFLERSQEVAEWIEGVIGERLISKDLSLALRDGIVLCKLANKISSKRSALLPTPIPPIKFYYGCNADVFQQIENIALFLKFAAEVFGISDRFAESDLYLARDMPKVVNCLHTLYLTHSIADTTPPGLRKNFSEIEKEVAVHLFARSLHR